MSSQTSPRRQIENNNKPYLKNCPTLNSQEASSVNFDFTEETYKQIQNMIEQLPGLTAKEYAEKTYFYEFTPETLTKALKLFNTWPNSYYNVCGPFICKNDRWFPVYSKKYVDTLKLAQENTVLRNRIKELEYKLATKVV